MRSISLLLVGLLARGVLAADEGKLINFNDNGAWCWFQDPRVLRDQTNDTLLIASVAAADGVDGATRGGDVDLVWYRLANGGKQRIVLHHALLPQDDHNTAALM